MLTLLVNWVCKCIPHFIHKRSSNKIYYVSVECGLLVKHTLKLLFFFFAFVHFTLDNPSGACPLWRIHALFGWSLVDCCHVKCNKWCYQRSLNCPSSLIIARNSVKDRNWRIESTNSYDESNWMPLISIHCQSTYYLYVIYLCIVKIWWKFVASLSKNSILVKMIHNWLVYLRICTVIIFKKVNKLGHIKYLCPVCTIDWNFPQVDSLYQSASCTFPLRKLFELQKVYFHRVMLELIFLFSFIYNIWKNTLELRQNQTCRVTFLNFHVAMKTLPNYPVVTLVHLDFLPQ